MPINLKKYAAIDIGSNAVRLFIADVIEHDGPTQFKKSELVRVPIRLGADAFLKHEISEENIKRLIDAMKAFRLLMNVNGVTAYKACATSAMREAKNANTVVQHVLDETELQIDIIDGQTEAKIIAATDLNEILDSRKIYLYVDVGGGSTEFSVLIKGKRVHSKSFKIGTVRLLNDKVSEETWQAAETWVKTHTQAHDKIYLLGTGGNINKLHKMAGIKEVRIWGSFSEDHNGSYVAELRSREIPIVDIAKKYGGGGHLNACGATLDTIEKVYQLIEDLNEKVILHDKHTTRN